MEGQGKGERGRARQGENEAAPLGWGGVPPSPAMTRDRAESLICCRPYQNVPSQTSL